jgi:hypothetical protein
MSSEKAKVREEVLAMEVFFSQGAPCYLAHVLPTFI